METEMNLDNIREVATRVGGRTLLQTQKHSPIILTAAGIGGLVATIVVASRATLKLESVIDETQGNLKTVQKLADEERQDYTPEDQVKDKTLIYVQTVSKVIKLYAPSIALGTISIAAILGGHNILSRRNAAISAAYVALERGFQEYRSRVRNELGEEKERELVFGKEIEETYKDEATGDIIKVSYPDPTFLSLSPYARYFDEFATEWRRDPGYNAYFVKAQQNYWNERLRIRGHVFLNEVYDALGIPRSQEATIVGWVFDPDGVKGTGGDNYIDFGLYNEENEKAREFVNGWEKSILLDFNVDGIIWDKI
jgi:hypothetical protein